MPAFAAHPVPLSLVFQWTGCSFAARMCRMCSAKGMRCCCSLRQRRALGPPAQQLQSGQAGGKTDHCNKNQDATALLSANRCWRRLTLTVKSNSARPTGARVPATDILFDYTNSGSLKAFSFECVEQASPQREHSCIV